MVATSTFDALHRLNWPHLWRNDTWTVSSYVTTPLTTSRKVLMGQASKGLPRNWTGGRLGCIGGNYIRKWPPQKWACNAGKRREKKKNKNSLQKNYTWPIYEQFVLGLARGGILCWIYVSYPFSLSPVILESELAWLCSLCIKSTLLQIYCFELIG